jgi:hypothetical protein
MPNITNRDVQGLMGLFSAMVVLAQKIEKKAPNCKGECDEIGQHGQSAFVILSELQRDSN